MSTKVLKKDPPPPLCITKQLIALKIGECLEHRANRPYAAVSADCQRARELTADEKPKRRFLIRSIRDKANPGHVDIYCVKA